MSGGDLRPLLVTDCFRDSIGGMEWSIERIGRILTEAGGAPSIVVRSLSAAGSDCTVAVTDASGTPCLSFHPADELSEPFRNRRYLQEWHQFVARLIEQTEHPLLHLFGTGPGIFAAAMAGRCAGVPLVLALRGPDFSRDIFYDRRVAQIRWLIEATNTVVCVTRELGDMVRAFHPPASGKVRTVYNSTADRWFADVDAVLPADSEVPLIGCVGPIREQSGFNEVLASLLRLRQSRRFRLAILGDFHTRDGVTARRQFTRSQIFEESIVTGPLPHSSMLSYMRRCAIGVMAPRTDGCPNKLLELMLAGVPTVCSALGGAVEIIETGKTGILVPPRDVEAMSDALRHLLDNAPERNAIGRAARELVLSQRTSDIERDEWISAYADAHIL